MHKRQGGNIRYARTQSQNVRVWTKLQCETARGLEKNLGTRAEAVEIAWFGAKANEQTTEKHSRNRCEQVPAHSQLSLLCLGIGSPRPLGPATEVLIL